MLAEMMLVGCLVTSYYVVPVKSQPGVDYDDDEYIEFVKMHGDFVKACGAGVAYGAQEAREQFQRDSEIRQDLMTHAGEYIEKTLKEHGVDFVIVGTAAITGQLGKTLSKNQYFAAAISELIKNVVRQVLSENKIENDQELEDRIREKVTKELEAKMESKMSAVYEQVQMYQELVEAQGNIDSEEAAKNAKKQELEQKAEERSSHSHDHRPDRSSGRGGSEYGPYRDGYKTGPNQEFADKMGNSWKPSPTPPNLVERRKD